MTTQAERIIENYKKNEHARINGVIHAATALAGGALYKGESVGNEFLYILAILFSASAYGFWYLTELAHARTQLWMIETAKGIEEAKKRPSYVAGLFGQVVTFAVIFGSFFSTLIGFTFDFVVTETIAIEREIAALLIFSAAIIVGGTLIWFFQRVLKLE
jgi:hypothetical protein